MCRPALDIAFYAYHTLIGHYNPHGTDYLKKELNGVTEHQFHIRFKHTHLEYSGTPPSPPERPYEGQQSSHSVDKTVCPKSADMSAVSFSTLFSSLNFSVLDKFFLVSTLATSTCCTAAVRILLYACVHRLKIHLGSKFFWR